MIRGQRSIHRTRLVEFDVSMLEHDAFDYVYRTTSYLVIDNIMGMMVGSTDLTEPNWAILGAYIEKPACRLMRKSRRK